MTEHMASHRLVPYRKACTSLIARNHPLNKTVLRSPVDVAALLWRVRVRVGRCPVPELGGLTSLGCAAGLGSRGAQG